MRKLLTFMAVMAVMATAANCWSVAQAADSPTMRIPGDIGFRDRLAAGQVIFTGEVLTASSLGRPFDDAVIIRDPAAEAAVSSIMDRLIIVHEGPRPSKLPFILIQSPDVGCQTAKTGEAIACTTRFMEVMAKAGDAGESQLAFVLAHELAHAVIAEHRKRFQKVDETKQGFSKLGLYAAMTGAIVLAHKTTVGNTVTITPTAASSAVFWDSAMGGIDAGETAAGLLAPDWSQRDEDEADAYAMILVKRAGFDDTQAAQLLGTLQDEEQRYTASRGFLSSIAGAAVVGAGRQALLNNGGWQNAAMGAITGGAAAWAREHANAHYHRKLDQRASFCSYEAALDKPAPTAGAFDALFRQVDAPPQPTVTPAAPAVRTASKGRRRPASSTASAGRAAAPVVVETAWHRFVRLSAPAREEAELAYQVRDALTAGGAKAAIALCPTKSPPITSHLALYCGLAQAGAKNPAAANALFQRAISDPFANAGEFRLVAQAQAGGGDAPSAIRTLSTANDRFGDGRFYPDEIVIQGATGDMDAAKSTTETCRAKAVKAISELCTRALASLSQNNASKPFFSGSLR